MTDHASIIRHTQTWLSAVIIGHGLCPFAKREFDAGRIHYQVIETADLYEQLEQVLMAFEALDADDSRETSLLIFPAALGDFKDYLDVLGLAGKLLTDMDYDGVYQIASFHPQYRFEGAGRDDPSNYTNRSPYPMLHILREASVTAAVDGFDGPEKIPARNIKLTQKLGLTALQNLLADCYK